MVRPCGIVVNFTEMFTCESPTQIYLFLVFTFARGHDFDRLRYIAYDRACDLHPFLINLEKKGAYFTKHLLRNVFSSGYNYSMWISTLSLAVNHQVLLIQIASITHNTLTFRKCQAATLNVLNKLLNGLIATRKYLNAWRGIVSFFFMILMIDLHNQHRERQLRKFVMSTSSTVSGKRLSTVCITSFPSL